MSKEYDERASSILHSTTFLITDFMEAEEDYYKAKKIFHDRTKAIRKKLLLLKEEELELIRIKGKEDDKRG